MIPVTCDACGRTVGPEHVTERLRRLELATQYRPIHINILFLTDAPPATLNDYFYGPPERGAARSPAAQALFDALMSAVGNAPGERRDEQSLLSEFQRRGCYFAEAVECPLEPEGTARGHSIDAPDEVEFAARFGNTVANRIQFSYKPRSIVLLSSRTRGLLPMLSKAGLSDHLLHRGKPLDLPVAGDSASTVRFIVQLGGLVAQADPARVA